MGPAEPRAKALRLALALALSGAFQNANALQVIDTKDGASVEAILSIQEPTRIRIEGASITDVFGNGICCADGEGGLVIRDTMGVVHAESDGQYGDQYAAEFCLTAVHVPERTHAPFGVFPNPNQGAFTVRGGPAYAIRRIAVIDALGRTVAKVQGQGGAAQFLALDLPNGSYLLLVDGATGAAPARMVVAR